MTTMDQVVIQLQQELFTFKAKVAARVQIAAAMQARFVGHNPSSTRCSQSHRCEWPGTPKGIL